MKITIFYLFLLLSFSCAFAGQNPALSDSSCTKWHKISKIIARLPYNGLDEKPSKQEQSPQRLMSLGLILSILGWVGTPIIGGLGFFACIAGAILGFYGIVKARKLGEKKYGKGIAAIIIGGSALLLSFLVITIFTLFILLQEPIFF